MKLANTLFATVAIIALAGPAFAQNVTLSTTPTQTQAAVITSISNACAITGSLSTFTMSVNPNGAVTVPAGTQNITVTCNTPNGNIKIGSDDMVNSAAPTIVETASFTNKINFIGQANGSMFGGDTWQLDSRASTPSVTEATIGNGPGNNRRIRNLAVSVQNAAPAEGKLPVAGAYTGTLCITVDPSGSLVNNATTNADRFCAVVGQAS